MWRWFLGLAAIPGAVCLVAYKILPESPRYLSVVGRHDEAVKVRDPVLLLSVRVNLVLRRLLESGARLRPNRGNTQSATMSVLRSSGRTASYFELSSFSTILITTLPHRRSLRKLPG